MRRHRRTMKGGFLDSLSNTLSNWGSSISQGTSSMWEKTKNAVSSSTSQPPTQPPMTTTTYGGRTKHRRSRHRRTRSRHMRGGFKDNMPTSGIAAHASPISGVKMAGPHNWVGGRRRSRRHR